MKSLDSLEKKIKIDFKKKELLKRAFIHRSYLNETKEELVSNERLEFLGDAVLEFVVSLYLYQKYAKLAEGKLTALRSHLVCTSTLFMVAKELELGDYLFLSKGEEESKGRENQSILANTVEALIGAIYLDRGLETARKFIKKNILSKTKIFLEKGVTYDYKSKFQEKVQAKTKKSPFYKVLCEKGPDHKKEFKVAVLVDGEVYGIGKGGSKQRAEQQAAKEALRKKAI